MQFRLKPVAAALMFSAGLALAQGAQAVEVAAGDLEAALRGLASDTGIQILFDANELKGVRTSGAHGAASAEAALRQALEGTDYSFQATGNNSFVVKHQPPAKVVAADRVAEAAMDPIVISATRTEARLSQVPASVSVVTQDNFAEQQANTVADVMKRLPNVDFGGGPRADGQIPTIRGYQGNDIILLVDGARRNANYGLTTPLFIDPYFLSRAEVVRGPVSTYGSGGNGGAMVFTTLAAKDLLKSGQNLGADVRAGYGSGDLSHHYNARVYGKSDSGQVDALLAVGYQDFNDIRQAGGTVLTPNSGYGDSALLKAGVQASDKLRLELSHQAFNKTALEFNNPQVATGFTQLTHNRQSETVLKASTLSEQGEKALDVRVYNTRTTNQRDPNAAIAQLYWNSVVETFGLSAQNTTRIGVKGAGNHRLAYGIDAYQNKLNTISGAAANPVNPDGSAKVTGAFLQDEISIAAWRVIPSVRYDGYSATPANTALASNSNSHVSPKLAIGWEGMPGLNLYGSYGQAFRTPTVWEMYMNSPTPGFRRFAPNPTLQAQTDTTLEFGTHFEKSRISGNDDNLQVHAAIFQAKVKNLIQQVTIAGAVGAVNSMLQNQNVPGATKNGMELSGSYLIGSWEVNANYSNIRVKDDTTNLNLFSPPDKLAAQVRYAIPATDMSVLWGGTAVAAQDYDSTVLRRRSGYTVHDLYASWEPHGQKFKVDFGIGNLFDKRYLSYQQTQAAALTAYEIGRSYNLSVSGSF